MIDTHAHLHLINRNTEDVLAAAKEAGVYHVVQVAIDLPSIHRNLNEYALMPNCSITGGIHPLSVSDSLELDEVLAVLKAHVDAFVAIGETGLDYKYGKDNMALQKIFFGFLDTFRFFHPTVYDPDDESPTKFCLSLKVYDPELSPHSFDFEEVVVKKKFFLNLQTKL